jgi:hypothetical protein
MIPLRSIPWASCNIVYGGFSGALRMHSQGVSFQCADLRKLEFLSLIRECAQGRAKQAVVERSPPPILLAHCNIKGVCAEG